jgi:hypothetical protein
MAAGPSATELIARLDGSGGYTTHASLHPCAPPPLPAPSNVPRIYEGRGFARGRAWIRAKGTR